jgi:hypothetical protein
MSTQSSPVLRSRTMLSELSSPYALARRARSESPRRTPLLSMFAKSAIEKGLESFDPQALQMSIVGGSFAPSSFQKCSSQLAIRNDCAVYSSPMCCSLELNPETELDLSRPDDILDHLYPFRRTSSCSTLISNYQSSRSSEPAESTTPERITTR